MPHQPHPSAPQRGGVTYYPTEEGYTARVQIGKLCVEVKGLDDASEAEDAARAVLDALAKRRGVQPARVGDRHPARLIEALGGKSA